MSTAQAVNEISVPHHKSQSPEVYADLTMSSQMDKILAELAQELGTDRGGVFSRAVILLKFAVDARREGLAVGSATSPDVLEVEVVNL